MIMIIFVQESLAAHSFHVAVDDDDDDHHHHDAVIVAQSEFKKNTRVFV